jgi:hypothetical protein
MGGFANGERQTVTIVLNVTAAPGAAIEPRGRVMVGDSDTDMNGVNDSAGGYIAVIAAAVADLVATMGEGPGVAGSESLFVFSLRVENLASAAPKGELSADPAQGVVVACSTPSGTQFSSARAGQGAVESPELGGEGEVRFKLGTLEPGQSATAELTVSVSAPPGASLSFTASVLSAASDPDPANNAVSATVAVQQSGRATLRWEPPEDDGTTDKPAPRRLVVEEAEGAAAAPPDGQPPVPIGYKVYRSNQPNVTPLPGNLFATVPPSQTTANAPVAPGGTFFVVTACYPNGESAPSNEGSAGVPAALLTRIKVGRTKIVAVGSGFTDAVEVELDGIGFAAPAAVKKNRTKVVQKSPLVTSETIEQYMASHASVLITFRNSNGGVVAVTYMP